MYPNSGRAIKSVVSILVKIGYIFSVLTAIGTLAACMSVGDEDYFIIYVIGAIIVGGLVCLFTWIGGLWLYAYGEITDRLISIDERMERMERKANGVAPAAPAAPKAGTGAWKCACGRVNASYVNACACGVNRQEIQM